MQESWGARSERRDPIEQLLLLKNRFSGGLHLKPEEILVLEALHLLIEHEIEEDFLLESDLKDRILRTSDCLKLEIEPHQTNQLIQKLLQTGILRLTFGGTRQRYRLSRLGQSLAKCLLDEVDYGTDQLNALFTSALSGLRAARLAGNDALKHYLIHVLFDTIEEKIESKVLAIEEDLARRKERVRQTYAGQSDESRDKAQSDIEASRAALTELVEAVRGSSACEALDSEIDEVTREVEDPHLKELLRRAGTFIYRFRAKIDLMLSDLVEFIRNCAAYRALAFSVTARDRLCRAQEQILAYALEHPLEMPLLTMPEIPAWGLPPQRPVEKKPLVLDPARIKSLEEAPGTASTFEDPSWKERLLTVAREQWKTFDQGVDLAEWLLELSKTIPQVADQPDLALSFLASDWPAWVPPVIVSSRDDAWVALGGEWMIEPITLATGMDLTECTNG